MASLNKVLIIGNLCVDPKLSYLPSGQAVVNARVATNESYKDRQGNKVDRAEFHNVTIYGKQAEFTANYLRKGSLVMIEGSLRTRNYEKEGQKHYTTEVIAQRVQGLDGRKQDGQSTTSQSNPPNNGAGSQRSQGQNRGSQSSNDDLGPAFPTDSADLDKVPFGFALIPVAALLASLLSMGGVA